MLRECSSRHKQMMQAVFGENRAHLGCQGLDLGQFYSMLTSAESPGYNPTHQNLTPLGSAWVRQNLALYRELVTLTEWGLLNRAYGDNTQMLVSGSRFLCLGGQKFVEELEWALLVTHLRRDLYLYCSDSRETVRVVPPESVTLSQAQRWMHREDGGGESTGWLFTDFFVLRIEQSVKERMRQTLDVR